MQQSLDISGETFIQVDGELSGVLYEALKSSGPNYYLFESMLSKDTLHASIPLRLSYHISKRSSELEAVSTVLHSDSPFTDRKNDFTYVLNDHLGIYDTSLNRIKAKIISPSAVRMIESTVEEEMQSLSDKSNLELLINEILNQLDWSHGVKMSRIISLISKKLCNTVSTEELTCFLHRFCRCRVHRESYCAFSNIDCVLFKCPEDVQSLPDVTYPWISVDGTVNEKMISHFESVVLCYLFSFPYATLERIHSRIPLLSLAQVENFLLTMEQKRLIFRNTCRSITLDTPFSDTFANCSPKNARMIVSYHIV